MNKKKYANSLYLEQMEDNFLKELIIICNCFVTRWQWLLYMYTKYEAGY